MLTAFVCGHAFSVLQGMSTHSSDWIMVLPHDLIYPPLPQKSIASTHSQVLGIRTAAYEFGEGLNIILQQNYQSHFSFYYMHVSIMKELAYQLVY